MSQVNHTYLAERILDSLGLYPPCDQIRILAKALDLLSSDPKTQTSLNTRSAAKPLRIPKSRFLRDDEVRDFLSECTSEKLEFITVDKLREDIAERFGQERAPSRSALARVVKQMRLLAPSTLGGRRAN